MLDDNKDATPVGISAHEKARTYRQKQQALVFHTVVPEHDRSHAVLFTNLHSLFYACLKEALEKAELRES